MSNQYSGWGTGPPPLASPAGKREILNNLRNSDKKYRKPFESGNLAMLNLLGGDWNDYAQIVVNMLIADSLTNIEEALNELLRRTPLPADGQPSSWQPPPAPRTP